MKLLVLDTSTEFCSCALSLDDGRTLERSLWAPRRHADLILEQADELLREAGLTPAALDGLAFGRGPGSFTGLRIACGVVQGMALGLGLPVAPLSSLAALAQAAYAETGATAVLAAIDARMGEVYWGAYQCSAQGVMTLIGEECVCAPAAVPLPPAGAWLGSGSGWDSYHPLLQARLGSCCPRYLPAHYPQARDLLTLAKVAFAHQQVVPAEQALPVYLRNQVTHVHV